MTVSSSFEETHPGIKMKNKVKWAINVPNKPNK